MANPISLTELENDPRLFLYTSLTAGSSHIITATSRMETILKANKIPFQAIDTATDEKARRLWQRRAGQRKLPGLVKEGFVLGDLEEVEEWNEFGELKENIGPVPPNNAAPPAGGQTGVNIAPPIPVNPTATVGTAKLSQRPATGVSKAPPPQVDETKMRALPGAAEIAARNSNSKAAGASTIDDPPKAETMSSAPEEEEKSIATAADKLKAENHPNIDHLSAPASAIHSGTASPAPERTETSTETAPEEGVGAAASTHRGSEVKEAPKEEIKKVESESALPEETAEDEDEGTGAAAKGVENLQVGDGVKVQEQAAKEGGDAGKSVEE